jgi:hypothetical protein
MAANKSIDVQMKDLFIKDLQTNGLKLLLSHLTRDEALALFSETFPLPKAKVAVFLDENKKLLKPGSC